MPATMHGKEEHTCRYSTEELLRIGSAIPLVKHVLYKLSAQPEFASILRLPQDFLQHSRAFTPKSNSLLHTITTKDRSNRPQSSMQTSNASRGAEDNITDGNAASQPIQWNLRRRNSLDRSSQPYSAPTGIAAQRSENFQRFYRAVVSPTHVRVTAGGRIVPNTRVAFEWNSDNHNLESKNPPTETESTAQGLNTFFHGAPLPFGFMPPPGNFFPKGNLATMVSPPFVGFGTSPAIKNRSSIDISEASSNAEQSSALLQQIQVTDPAHFDNTKPFVYNGQIVFPVQPPTNAASTSMTIIGNPNFVPQVPGGHFAPPQQYPVPVPSLPNPLFPGHPLPLMPPHFATGTENMPGMFSFPQARMMPVPSLSDMTRSQIQGLRTYISALDSQMHAPGNDRNNFVQMRAGVVAQLKNMEVMLEAQLDVENTMRAANPERAATSENRNSAFAPRLQESASQVSQPPYHTPLELGVGQQIVPYNAQVPPKASTAVRSDSMTKSKLSASAAKAPPFQPRSQTVVVAPSQQEIEKLRSQSWTPTEEITPAMLKEIEKRLCSKASTNWSEIRNKVSVNAPTPAVPRLLKSQTMKETSIHPRPALSRTNTFHGKLEMTSAPHPQLNNVSGQNIPYLVGTLPQGVPVTGATANDLVYSRPLTEDEVRARYLYWGKAPRSIQSGLPKFDGKDFYPPSPVKSNARTAIHSATHGLAPIFNAPSAALPGSSQLFIEPGAPDYKTPTPLRPSFSHSDSVSVPLQNSMATCCASVQKPSNMSNHFSHSQEESHQQETHAHTKYEVSPEDFSGFFLERGAPGYKSPRQTRPFSIRGQAQPALTNFKAPVTPKSLEKFGDDEVATGNVNSWGASKDDNKRLDDSRALVKVAGATNKEEDQDEGDIDGHSSIEVPTTAQKYGRIQSSGESFKERVAKFSNVEQQMGFLRLLKTPGPRQNTKPMTGPAVSGMVSATNAIGYLPQYRGSAVASLAPAFSNASAERDIQGAYAKHQHSRDKFPSAAALDENRPLRQPTRLEDSAEACMTYITQSTQAEEDQKSVSVGWNTNTTGLGPIMGSEW